MIDKIKNTTVQDLSFAKVLGMNIKEIEILDINKQKNEMQNLAFKMQHDKMTIEQSEADILNNKYQEIVSILENEYNMDLSCDYWIDFDSFVLSNPYYNKFSY